MSAFAMMAQQQRAACAAAHRNMARALARYEAELAANSRIPKVKRSKK